LIAGEVEVASKLRTPRFRQMKGISNDRLTYVFFEILKIST